ncbi:exopolysaccharide biosynthesis protein [Primorskyibacter sp. 2E107]|uniref:exopolysaccharide biosynthesis protein n=1 Tax=Primorskyibacter sp. 2E107 TaxID=3403458 RepID=UPI003AF5E015
MSKVTTLTNPPDIPEEDTGPTSLCDVLDRVEPRDGEDAVSVETMLERIGTSSFPAIMLAPAVLLVSPVSGIPTVPTFGGLIMVIVALQALFGRKHLWLPGFLTRRKIKAGKLQRGVDWLRKPAAWMDRHSHGRLCFLTRKPLKWLAYVATIAIAVSWPVLEILPFVTSFGAGAIAMIMFGMMTRDGAYVVAGYVQGTALYLIVLALWGGLLGSGLGTSVSSFFGF